MRNGTCDCVLCFSVHGVGLRIVIWCETPWSKGQNTAPCCNFNI